MPVFNIEKVKTTWGLQHSLLYFILGLIIYTLARILGQLNAILEGLS